jgi:predicted nucleic acid-binding protein
MWHGQIAQACGARLIRYLIDTKVVSELRKPKPHGAAVTWLQSLELGQGFFSAVRFGEIQKGVELTPRQDL